MVTKPTADAWRALPEWRRARIRDWFRIIGPAMRPMNLPGPDGRLVRIEGEDYAAMADALESLEPADTAKDGVPQ